MPVACVYNGFNPIAGWSVDVVPVSIDPKRFFKEYIAACKPCIIDGLVVAQQNWLLDSLRQRAGSKDVFIEQRDAASSTFGTGVKTASKLATFLDSLLGGKTDIYLTTQPDVADGDGSEQRSWRLFSSPLDAMVGSFPLRPQLMGRLIPSSVNLWLGSSRDGTSSNLHHDHHANLYTLLKGRKRFTIAAPASAGSMYLHGHLTLVHPNGLLNYLGCPTRPDGVPLTLLDAEVDGDDDGGAGGIVDLDDSDADDDDGSNNDAAAAADDMWAALLGGGAAAAGSSGSGSASAGGARGTGAGGKPKPKVAPAATKTSKPAAGGKRKETADYITASKAKEGNSMKRGRATDAASSSSSAAPSSTSKANAAGAGSSSASSSSSAAAKAGSGSSARSSSASNIPDHFSRIPLPALRAEALRAIAADESAKPSASKRAKQQAASASNAGSIGSSDRPDAATLLARIQSSDTVTRQFPLFRDVVLTTFELKAGQSLFLPQGWFHEVESIGDQPPEPTASATDTSGAEANIHMALNHWFAPPTRKDFNKPYEDSYWQDIYEAACKGHGIKP